MNYRVSWALGLLFAGACHSSSANSEEDAGSNSDARVEDSASGHDAGPCTSPFVDWRIDEPLAAFTRASPAGDGWRIFGAGPDPLNASEGWLVTGEGALSSVGGLVDASWGDDSSGGASWNDASGDASGDLVVAEDDGTLRIGRFRESGEALWRGEYAHDRVIRSVEIVEDGRATYVVGTLRNVDLRDRDTLVVRFDDTGAVEWAQTFDWDTGSEATSNESYFGAFVDAAGRLVVANHLSLGGDVHEGVPVWIFALTDGGELAWEYVHDDYDMASYWGLVHDDEGMFLVGTRAHPDIQGPLQALRLNAEGELLWETMIDGAPDFRHHVRDALPTPDGGYLLSGMISDGTPARLWKLDANGELLWTATPGDFRADITNMVPFEEGYLLRSQVHMDDVTTAAFVGVGQDGDVLWRHHEGFEPSERSAHHTFRDLVTNARGEVLAVGYSAADDVRSAVAIQFGRRCR